MTAYRVLPAVALLIAGLVCSLHLHWEAPNVPTVIMVEPPPRIIGTIQNRIEAKRQVIDSLLAGELTLLQAAALFRSLNAASPYPNSASRVFPGTSDEEKLCRQVISWATGQVPESEVETIKQCMEEELDILLTQSNSKLVLPEL